MSTLFDLPFEDEDEDQTPATTPDAEAPAVERRRIQTVSEITALVQDVLEGRFPEVWVDGEISNCRPWRTGHVYFTLKDERAQLKAVMFRSAVRYLKFTPEDGLKVIVRGRITVYEPKGEYQIVCEHMEPRGLGALQLAYDQLRQRLEHEGLFDASRKQELPALPRKIGVVTSLNGAAVRDVVQVIRHRYANAHVIVRPTRVQGEGAALEIAAGLQAIGRVSGVDVAILARGGGSMEDLWAFNDEGVARAIAACPVPVIAGIGHETDTTIADFVADLRAPTPSAAAELVVARKREFGDRITRLRDRLTAATRSGLERSRVARAPRDQPAGDGWLAGETRTSRAARRRTDARPAASRSDRTRAPRPRIPRPGETTRSLRPAASRRAVAQSRAPRRCHPWRGHARHPYAPHRATRHPGWPTRQSQPARGARTRLRAVLGPGARPAHP